MGDNEINIPAKGIALTGELRLPTEPIGLVLFAHGSGSGRNSPRNQAVARILQKAGLGTLLFDLLTPEEEEAEAHSRHLRFDIPRLAERLAEATRWALEEAAPGDIPLGYFGSSTGAAAALVAAAEIGPAIRAVVSRGGRPDLAASALDRVTAATLLIVGGEDTPVISLNEEAYEKLHCEKALRIVQGASHLFEEHGKLEIVANMARDWFAGRFQSLAPRNR